MKLRGACGVLLLSDLISLFLAVFLAWGVRELSGGVLPLPRYTLLLPGLGLFILLYAAFGLYPGILRPPSYELKWLTIGSSIGFSFLAVFFFLGQQGTTYSRLVFVCGWLFALCLVPLGRYLARLLCSGASWWGYPVILFSAAAAEEITRRFVNAPESALRIAAQAVIIPDKPGNGAEAGSLSLQDPAAAAQTLAALQREHPGALAFIMADGLSETQVEQLTLLVCKYFKQLLVHPDSPWLNHFSLYTVEAPSGPALSLRQNLLDPTRMRIKRLIDIAGCLCAAPLLLLLMPCIALAIRLDSRGPVFFRQERIGRNGKPLRVFKFRTMVPDAEERLKTLLASSPALRAEWEQEQKLADDPRITRMGSILRRTSLDELPQIFNIILGQMSLVGPRPIVEGEIAHYGAAYATYTRVTPGLTGLWQVSGRNDLDYGTRVALDQHYVYNWSVWLDISIILRTVPVVLSKKGAY